jgi:hypothetical protein
MNSDEDKLYIKIIALGEIYNFVVEKFSNWNCLGSQNIVVSAQILNFKILSYQTTSDVDMVYTKVIVLNKIYNFVVEKFLIWRCLESQICVQRL